MISESRQPSGLDPEIARTARIHDGVKLIRADWRAFLGLIIAASDRPTLVTSVASRFGVDQEVASIALEQQLIAIVELPPE